MKADICVIIICGVLIELSDLAPTTTPTPTTPDNDFLARLPDELITPNNKGWDVYMNDNIVSSFNSAPLVWALNNTIPQWINGSYVKNGPARKMFSSDLPSDKFYSSYLDSWGKLHKFTFSNGSVQFSCRMIETSNYNISAKANELAPSLTLAPTLPKQWNSTHEFTEMVTNGNDNANYKLWRLGEEGNGQYLAVGGFAVVQEMDMDTLTIKETKEFDQKSLATSPHWRRDVGANSSINFHILENENGGVNFTLFRFNSTYEDHAQIGSFALPHQSLIHMVSNTPNYAVIVVCPVSIDFQAINNNQTYPVDTATELNDSTKVYLMNLRDGTVLDGFEVNDTSFAFTTHHVNAWEESQDVVFDIVTRPWDEKSYFMDLDTVLHHPETNDIAAKTVVKRIKLNLVTQEVKVEDWPNKRGIPLLNTIDYPVINQDFVGIKNQFVYGWASVDFWKQTLVKKDLVDSSQDKTWSKSSHYPGEMFFIPTPGGKTEDDGVLVTVVFDGDIEQSYLLILDAKNFTEINLAYLPVVVPFSFHGNWFPELH